MATFTFVGWAGQVLPFFPRSYALRLTLECFGNQVTPLECQGLVSAAEPAVAAYLQRLTHPLPSGLRLAGLDGLPCLLPDCSWRLYVVSFCWGVLPPSICASLHFFFFTLVLWNSVCSLLFWVLSFTATQDTLGQMPNYLEGKMMGILCLFSKTKAYDLQSPSFWPSSMRPEVTFPLCSGSQNEVGLPPQ